MSLVTPRKGYKSVPWFFGKEIEIPREWEFVELKSLCNLLTKQTGFDYTAHIKPKLIRTFKKGTIPFIQNKDFKGKKTNYDTDYFIPENIANIFTKILLNEKCLLITISGNIGNVGIFSNQQNAFVGGAIAVAKFKNKNQLDWTMQYLLSPVGQKTFLRLTKTASHQNLILEDIRKIKIIVPPFPEQQKITTILSNVDSLIESTSKVIENSKKIKKGLMQELLTRGIGHTKFKKVPWLFGKKIEIPQEWEIKRLDEIGEIIGGGTPDSTNKDYWDGEILWAVPTDITKLQINQIENTERKITKLGLKNSSAKLLPIETILITSRATVGECAITTKPISTNQGFQNIICNDRHHNYLIFYLIEQFTNNLLRLSHGTTFLEISKNQIKKVIIPVSNSLPEQQKIASILSNIDSKIDSQEQYKEKLQKLKKSLMQKLLTGEVRV